MTDVSGMTQDTENGVAQTIREQEEMLARTQDPKSLAMRYAPNPSKLVLCRLITVIYVVTGEASTTKTNRRGEEGRTPC